MRSQVLVAAGISAASASAVFPRQDDSSCLSALSDVQPALEAFPAVPTDDDFIGLLLSQDFNTDTADDACLIPSVTGEASLVSRYSAFVAEATSWIDENRDAVTSAYSACESNSVFSSLVDELGLPSDTSVFCETWTFQTPSSASASSTGVASDVPSSASATPTPAPADETTPGPATNGSAPTTTGGSEEAEPSESAPPEGAAARQTGMAIVAAAVAVVAAVGLM